MKFIEDKTNMGKIWGNLMCLGGWVQNTTSDQIAARKKVRGQVFSYGLSELGLTAGQA